MSLIDVSIQQAIALLKQAQYVVALTGAGISTPSGIPDFRSPASGLWERYDPMEVASFYNFKQHPEQFYDWIRPLLRKIMYAEPNAAHHALVQLESYGPLKAVITQNIDLLHTKAGHQQLYEVHGHLRDATCLRCFNIYQSDIVLIDAVETGKVPYCPDCGGLLKPNIILFGEILPISVLNGAKRQIQSCDLMIAIGSSLEVAPAGDLPYFAKQYGAKLIIINLEETHLDVMADVVIRANVIDILPHLATPFLPDFVSS